MDYKKKLSKLLKKTQAELWGKYSDEADKFGTLTVNKGGRYSDLKMYITKDGISVHNINFIFVHYMCGDTETLLVQSDILTSGLYTPEDWYDWTKKTIKEITSEIFIG